jgi:hypothetical protein
MNKTVFRCNVVLSIVALLWLSMMFVPISKASWVISHSWFPADSNVQDYVQYAYDISWWDMDFITTLEAENWLWSPTRQSEVINSYGKREDSWGFCQIHRRWHSDIVDDPRFFSDPYRQLDKCLEKYMWGTKFYWYYVRHWLDKRFSLDWHNVDNYTIVTETKPEWVQQWNPYIEAKKKQAELEKLHEQIRIAKKEAKELRSQCIKSWQCKE